VGVHNCLGAVVLATCFSCLYQAIETQLNHDNDMIGGPVLTASLLAEFLRCFCDFRLEAS